MATEPSKDTFGCESAYFTPPKPTPAEATVGCCSDGAEINAGLRQRISEAVADVKAHEATAAEILAAHAQAIRERDEVRRRVECGTQWPAPCADTLIDCRYHAGLKLAAAEKALAVATSALTTIEDMRVKANIYINELEAREAELVEALRNLTSKLREIHANPRYRAVWVVGYLHYGIDAVLCKRLEDVLGQAEALLATTEQKR